MTETDQLHRPCVTIPCCDDQGCYAATGGTVLQPCVNACGALCCHLSQLARSCDEHAPRQQSRPAPREWHQLTNHQPWADFAVNSPASNLLPSPSSMARTKKRAAAESEHSGTQSAQEFLSSNYTERRGPGVLILHIPVAQDRCRCGRSPVTPTRICLFPHVFNSHILCHTFSGFFSHRLSCLYMWFLECSIY